MIDRRRLLLAAAAMAAAPRLARAAPPRTVSLRLLTFNVNVRSKAFDRFAAFLAEQDPDVVLLQEADEPWLTHTPLADYPATRFGIGKMVMASRFPFLDAPEFAAMSYSEKKKLGRRSTIQRALMAVDGTDDPSTAVILYNLHPASPRTSAGREQQLADYANFERVMRADPPGRTVLGGGDFNALPDTPVFADLRARVGLDILGGDTLRLPTRFPREIGLGSWVGVPIDHVVARGPVTLKRRVVGPELGSDHVPVIADVEIALPPPGD